MINCIVILESNVYHENLLQIFYGIQCCFKYQQPASKNDYFLHMMTQTFTEKICEFVDQGRFYIKRLKYRYYA